MASPDQRIADGSSRAGVLAVLRDRGDLVRVEDLAGAVGLSVSAVRFHLDRLVGDGLVRSARQPRLTPGRPRVMYRAVPVEAVDDAAAYRHLAALLAAELAARGGVSAAESAGHLWATQVARSPAAGRAAEPAGTPAGVSGGALAGSGPDSLPSVMAVLEDGGFAPRVRDDGWSLELHRCPFVALMPAESEMVCAVHRGLVRSIPELRGDADPAVLLPVPDVDAPCIVRFAAGRRSPRQGSERQGSQRQGSQRQGSERQGSQRQGSQRQGSQRQGSRRQVPAARVATGATGG
jgi:predicted ArsR family transcriptional regulator